MSDPTGTVPTMASELILIALIAACVGAAVGVGTVVSMRRRREALNPATPPSAESDVVATSLTELARRVDVVAKGQAAAHVQLSEQLRAVAQGNSALLRDTGRLAEALNHTGYRGRWGEVQLRRIVEAAGLTRGVHFTEQLRVVGDESTIKPDMVITLSDSQTIVIDAKVPLDALLDAPANDPAGGSEIGAVTSARHAAAVEAHIDQLASKSYWRQFSNAPEFVVLFLPAESLLGQALSENPGLLERAFSRNVVLATPTTLLALLRTVALGWKSHDLAENAAAIQALGGELHERLRVMNAHLVRLGSSLGSAADSYNKLVGSYESRVLVSSRKMSELGISQESLESPSPLDRRIREPSGVALTGSPPP